MLFLAYNPWRFFDSAMFVLQVGVILFSIIYFRRHFDTLTAFALGYIQYLFCTPLTLITYNRVITDNRTDILRLWPWHLKLPIQGIASISINDIIALSFLACLVIGVRIGDKLEIKRILWLLLVNLVGITGVLSLEFSPTPFAARSFVYVMRNFVFINVAALIGIRLCRYNSINSWWQPLSRYLVILFVMSTIGYAALDPSLRWHRFDTPSILATQNWAFISALCLWMLLFETLSWKWKVLCLAGTLVPYVAFFKYGIFYQCLIVGCYLLKPYIRNSRSGRTLVVVAVVAASLLLPIVSVYLNSVKTTKVTEIDPSLSTRYYQMVNAITTVEKAGLPALALGIGWKQPYFEYLPFEFFDQYAWGEEDSPEEGLFINIQLPLIALFRSAGCVGLIVVGTIIVRMIKGLSTVDEMAGSLKYYALSVLSLSYFGSLGELAAEYVVFAVVISFAFGLKNPLRPVNRTHQTSRPAKVDLVPSTV